MFISDALERGFTWQASPVLLVGDTALCLYQIREHFFQKGCGLTNKWARGKFVPYKVYRRVPFCDDRPIGNDQSWLHTDAAIALRVSEAERLLSVAGSVLLLCRSYNSFALNL